MNKIFEILIDLYIYDVEVLSQPWVLWTIVPGILYMCFMFLKWTVLTCPLWLPITIILGAFTVNKS